jgi:putative monooxygenase ydhR
MPGYLLQLNFSLTIPVDEYERMVTPVAHAIAAVDGLRWKIWIVNPAEGQAGGFYHFETEAAADAYLAGPIITALRAAPFQRDLTVKRYGYLVGPTAIDRGPVDANAPVIVPGAVAADTAHALHATIDRAPELSA